MCVYAYISSCIHTCACAGIWAYQPSDPTLTYLKKFIPSALPTASSFVAIISDGLQFPKQCQYTEMPIC